MECRYWPKLLLLCMILSVNFLSISQEPFNFKSDSIACDSFPPPRNLEFMTIDNLIMIWWEIPLIDPNSGIVPSNLMAYKIIKDGVDYDTIPNTGEDTIYFYDELGTCYPLSNDFSVCALYELDLCGLPGEIGQSNCEGPITGYGFGAFILSFQEDFSTGSFDPNLWYADESWYVSGEYGHPSPCALYSNTPDSSYHQSLISWCINCLMHPGTEDPYIDGDILFDFEIKLNHLPLGATDYLNIELQDTIQWFIIDQFSTDTGSFGWTEQSINITQWAKGNIISIAFIAHGDTGLNITDWYIDNIKVYRQCNPPRDLHWVSPDEVMAWSPPLPHTPTKGYKGKGLQGYNIYISYGSQYEFHSFTTDTFHIVDAVGWKSFYITAKYEDCEPASNEIFGPQSLPDNPAEEELVLFPNPCSDILNVKSSLPLQSIQIFNTRGELVLNSTSNNTEIDINTSTFPSGVYLVKSTTLSSIQFRKLLIKR